MMHDVHVTNEEQINCSRVTDWVEDMEVVERKAPTSNGGSSPDIGSDSPDAQKRSNKYIIYKYVCVSYTYMHIYIMHPVVQFHQKCRLC